MLKRILCVLSSFMILAGSAYAWDSESFIGMDENNYYEFDWHPSFQPALMSLSPYALSDSQSWSGSVDLRSGVSSFSNNNRFGLIGNGEMVVLGQTYHNLPFAFASGKFVPGYVNNQYSDYLTFGSSSIEWDLSSYSDWNFSYWEVPSCIIKWDIPVPSDVYSFELLPSITSGCVFYGPVEYYPSIFTSLQVEIDGQFQGSLSAHTNTLLDESLRYDSSSPIQSVSVYLTYPEFSVSSGLPTSRTGVQSLGCNWYFYDNSFMNYAFLGADQALIGNIDDAQNSISGHEALESEWVGSMSSNFDSLNLQGFSFPSGLVSGFSLFSGLFNDIWNSMGDFRVVYVFPLLLSLTLVVIGRVSKSAGRSKGGGDDS